MAKTIDEFKEELRVLRAEMYQSAENADLRLIASYLDRLVISLEELSDTLAVMEAGTEMMLSSEEAQLDAMRECHCPACMAESKPKKAKKAKKPKKKGRR